jgi:hypothetical protein
MFSYASKINGVLTTYTTLSFAVNPISGYALSSLCQRNFMLKLCYTLISANLFCYCCFLNGKFGHRKCCSFNWELNNTNKDVKGPLVFTLDWDVQIDYACLSSEVLISQNDKTLSSSDQHA